MTECDGECRRHTLCSHCLALQDKRGEGAALLSGDELGGSGGGSGELEERSKQRLSGVSPLIEVAGSRKGHGRRVDGRRTAASIPKPIMGP